MVSRTEVDQTQDQSNDAEAKEGNLRCHMLLSARINANRWPIHRMPPIDLIWCSREVC